MISIVNSSTLTERRTSEILCSLPELRHRRGVYLCGRVVARGQAVFCCLFGGRDVAVEHFGRIAGAAVDVYPDGRKMGTCGVALVGDERSLDARRGTVVHSRPGGYRAYLPVGQLRSPHAV